MWRVRRRDVVTPASWSVSARSMPARSPSTAGPLDAAFVADAIHHEPSAADRQAAARRARSPWRRRWHHLRTTDVRSPARAVVAGAVVVALMATPGLVAGTRAAALPSTLQLVIAVPERGQASAGLVAAIEHEAALAAGWLEQQTGGTLRGDLSDALVVLVRLPDAPLVGDEETATDAVGRAVDLRRLDADGLPVIVTTLGLAEAPDTCGMGGPRGVVVFLGNCGMPPAATTAAFGQGVNRTIAHELVHALGGVAPCAPNHAEDGHVVDDPDDLMTAVTVVGSPTPVLDVAGDDYFGRGGDVCADIMDSPLWE